MSKVDGSEQMQRSPTKSDFTREADFTAKRNYPQYWRYLFTFA